jgi:hypothetical protein
LCVRGGGRRVAFIFAYLKFDELMKCPSLPSPSLPSYSFRCCRSNRRALICRSKNHTNVRHRMFARFFSGDAAACLHDSSMSLCLHRTQVVQADEKRFGAWPATRSFSTIKVTTSASSTANCCHIAIHALISNSSISPPLYQSIKSLPC